MRIPVAAFAAFLALALAGCDSTNPSTAEAPALISPVAFELGDDAFPDASGALKSAGANHTNAAFRVGIVTAIIGLNLALPHAATAAVTRETPTVTEDGVWVWTTTVDVLGTSVDLRLEGDPEGSSVDWRLTTAAAGDEPFTYYTATTRLDGKTGSWRLFHPNENGVVLTADFDVRDPDRREVTFAVPAGRESGGSSVLYQTDGTELTFDWLDMPENDRALIVWDEVTGAGFIEADTYRGGERSCWDENLDDAACPTS